MREIQYNTNCKHFYSFSSSVSPTRFACPPRHVPCVVGSGSQRHEQRHSLASRVAVLSVSVSCLCARLLRVLVGVCQLRSASVSRRGSQSWSASVRHAGKSLSAQAGKSLSVSCPCPCPCLAGLVCPLLSLSRRPRRPVCRVASRRRRRRVLSVALSSAPLGRLARLRDAQPLGRLARLRASCLPARLLPACALWTHSLRLSRRLPRRVMAAVAAALS